MAHNNDGTVTVAVEVEKRLEDLFGISEKSPPFAGDSDASGKAPVGKLKEVPLVFDDRNEKEHFTRGKSGNRPESIEDTDNLNDSKLRYLKTIVLSIDWEISEETMKGLIEETDRLRNVYKDDKTFALFFQLLGSVGRYIKTKKAGSHPGAITLLNSIYLSLEKTILFTNMTATERKKALLVQVEKFKQLKAKISLAKTSSPGILKEKSKPDGAMQEVARSDIRRMQPHEAFAFALEEIKDVIKVEFKALRAELKLWREGQ